MMQMMKRKASAMVTAFSVATATFAFGGVANANEHAERMDRAAEGYDRAGNDSGAREARDAARDARERPDHADQIERDFNRGS